MEVHRNTQLLAYDISQTVRVRAGADSFHLFFALSQNHLIIDKTVSRGTVYQTPVCPREIINLILRHLTHAAIFVRNHPGAETKPSRADIEVSKDIKKALAVMDIALHDHPIAAGASCVSLKSLGHL